MVKGANDMLEELQAILVDLGAKVEKQVERKGMRILYFILSFT